MTIFQSFHYHTTFSSIDYGDFTIEDIFPLYGPMFGNEKVCIELKGHVPKDLHTVLLIILTEDQTNWFHPITNFRKKGTNLTFQMPPFPFPSIIRAKINIEIQYKQDIIHRVNYIYTSKLDGKVRVIQSFHKFLVFVLTHIFGFVLSC